MIRRLSKGLGRRGRRLLARVSGTLVRVDTQERVAALTFDDGPDPTFTPRLLDLLARHGARATFFMIGERAAAHPELVARVAAAGHAIGNHSWDHPRFASITPLQQHRQLTACENALAPHGGRLFRPPFGIQTVGSQLMVAAHGYTHVGWSADAEDWVEHDVDWFVQRLHARIGPGDILLLHDALWRPRHPGASDRFPLLTALDLVLQNARFSFLTVPELLERGHPVRVAWVRADDEPAPRRARPANAGI